MTDTTDPWRPPGGTDAQAQNDRTPPAPTAPPPIGQGTQWGPAPTPAPAPPGWWLASDGRWYPPQNPAAPTPYAYGGYTATPRTNGMAIAAMVLGILWLYWVGSVLALVFGYIARRQIDESRGTQGGRGMATAGIVLGWVGVGFFCLFFVFGFLAALA